MGDGQRDEGGRREREIEGHSVEDGPAHDSFDPVDVADDVKARCIQIYAQVGKQAGRKGDEKVRWKRA